MKWNDTIAAVSTPRGKGGVALLRVSGEEALSVAARVFTPRSGKPLCSYPPRTEVYGTFYRVEGEEKQPLDDCLAVFFPAPHSFTGEDTVEVCCHGGALLTQTVLTQLLLSGARQAEAGEFTRRAFLNGKLGLSAAESLGELLEAGSQEQLLLAHGGMSGVREKKMGEIYADLSLVLSSVYARIDYPDEDLADLSPDEMAAKLRKSEAELEGLAETYRTGHAVAEGISTVICGAPNVGKSTLYNALVGREAAIVTSVAGTTRDVLSETVSLGGVTLRLSDTAGIHETGDEVEKIGVLRAREKRAEAELILCVVDGSRPLSPEETELLEESRTLPGHLLVILNKSDLPRRAVLPEGLEILPVSARTGRGMKELQEKVSGLFLSGSLSLGTDPILTNARQYAAVRKSLDAVREAIRNLREGYPVDFCCQTVETAMQYVAEVDGRTVSEDVVSSIFSHFCVGK